MNANQYQFITHKGSGHIREYVPVLVHSRCLKEMGELKPLNTFADIGATIAENFKPRYELFMQFEMKYVVIRGLWINPWRNTPRLHHAIRVHRCGQ